MPKKTLALISGLVLVTFLLFVIALRSANKSTENQQMVDNKLQQNSIEDSEEAQMQVSAHSVLRLSPKPVSLSAGAKGNVMVMLEPSDNEVTAVQLEIAYDPNIISNVKVTPGELFDNPVVLINKNNISEGRYTYAFGIMPNHKAITTSGVVANITFSALNKPGANSQLALLDTTLVTAKGISNSVLKSTEGTLVQISK